MIKNLKIKVGPITSHAEITKSIEQGKPIKDDEGYYHLNLHLDAKPDTIKKMVEYLKTLGEILPPGTK